MSFMKIPDTVLQKLHCRCGEYLSKPPINIQDDQILCSNCTGSLTSTSNCSPYEALAGLFAFPCRYKSQGCQQYIKFEDVKNHEAICTYRTVNCPANFHSVCVWEGALTQVYDHYQTQHPKLCIQTPNFPIRVDESYEVYRITKVNNTVLLLQVKCTVEKDLLWFNMVCFRSADDVELIKYTIKLSTTKRFLMLEEAHPMPVTSMQMVPAESLKVSISSIICVLQDPIIDCQWLVDILPQELGNKSLIKIQTATLKCPNCNIYMIPPIYRCFQGHVTCADCKGYNYECKICHKTNITFTEAVDFLQVVKSEQYYCRWAFCSKPFPYTEIRQHEQNCAHRVYKCPECLTWSGLLCAIMEHFRTTHPKTLIYLSNQITVCGNTAGYIFTLGGVFQFNIANTPQMFNTHNCTVDIYYLGPPSFVYCWEYKVMRQPGNVPVALERKGLNLFSANNVSSSFGSGLIFGAVPFTNTNSSIQCTLSITKRNNI